MFYQVKIKDKEGRIKKVISSKSLHRRHWKQFSLTLSLCGAKPSHTLISQYDYGIPDTLPT